jgi:hypothetical protein
MSENMMTTMITAIAVLVNTILLMWHSRKLNHITTLTNSTLTAANTKIAELKSIIENK